MRDRETDRETTGTVGSMHLDTTHGSSRSEERTDRRRALQQSVGNQAVQQLHERGRLQARLAVSHPADRSEREARRVADRVLRAPAPSVDADSEAPAAVPDRSEGGELLDRLAMGPQQRGDSDYLARSNDDTGAGSAKATKTGSTPQRLKPALGGGTPLPEQSRSFFEPRFGVDFSDVRVHTGPQADEAARSIQAEAFTYETDIVFRDDAYDPGSQQGRKLLAHELTHVVDQTDAQPADTSDGQGRVAVQSNTTEPTIQRGIGGAALEMLSQPFENMGQDADSIMGIPHPLAAAFDSVVTASIASASGISIKQSSWDVVEEYCENHPQDATTLLPAIYRGPSFWQGGLILDLQPAAGAMTLDDDVFVDGTLYLDTFVHELYHVYQYSQMGKVSFLTAYFGTSAYEIAKRWMQGQPLNPANSSWLEDEAYALERRFVNWYNSNKSGTAGNTKA